VKATETRLQLALITLLVSSSVGPRMQGPPEPVWVPQNPPFGAVAALMGLPDLRSIMPVAGPALTDVRVADSPNPFIYRPGNYLRLTRLGDRINARLFIWWFGNAGPYEPPADPSRRCTAPTEAVRVCVQEVSLASRDWRPLMQTVLQAQPCGTSRPTDQYELRLQIFDKQYRESDVCDPLAQEVGKLFQTLSPR
jgi:hypothetical protein